MTQTALPLSIRDVAPGPGFSRLTGTRLDGLPDGIHTGGAWLSSDGREVWKPMDCRPFANAECHVPTEEYAALEMMAGQPAFPRNWRVEERNGRRFLVRARALLVPGDEISPSALQIEDLETVEAGLRALNSRYWALGDVVSVAFDVECGPFILDLSNVHRELPPMPADDEWRFLDWLKRLGFDRLARLREDACHACHAVHTIEVQLGRNTDGWPGPEWTHVYASLSRPISGMWATINDAYYVAADYGATGVWTWVVTPRPLDPSILKRYELVWGWAPIAYEEAWLPGREEKSAEPGGAPAGGVVQGALF